MESGCCFFSMDVKRGMHGLPGRAGRPVACPVIIWFAVCLRPAVHSETEQLPLRDPEAARRVRSGPDGLLRQGRRRPGEVSRCNPTI